MKSVLITGANGGLGKSLCSVFLEGGFNVIATDLHPTSKIENYISVDVLKLIYDKNTREEFKSEVEKISKGSLSGIVNNAAIQILGSVSSLSLEDFQETLDVNLKTPLMITKLFLNELEKNIGSIINISSIHSKLTKQEFVAYATSKAALDGLTKAMAVDLGPKIRVNSINPAAIDTDMLRAGFNNNLEKVKKLASYHPTQSIATPVEVAKLAFLLMNDNLQFLTGANINIDGGIGSVLHDPS